MPSSLPYSPLEARQILATRQRQLEACRQNDAQLDSMVESINQARGELENQLQEYILKCDTLRNAARRHALSESSATYRNFASMQLRLGGAMKQALKRAETGGRLLDAAKAEREFEDRKEEADRVRMEVLASQRQVEHSLLPAHDDFESLYGDYDEEEELSDAS